MQSSITLSSMAALFSTMLVLALIPSVSVLLVTSRAAASGFIHGASTTLGIITGDIIYILVAIFGLSLLSGMMGDVFFLVRYIGGAYLIWLGITLYRSKLTGRNTYMATDSSLSSSFLSGLAITLADQKAILFYLGLFPAFVDLATLSIADSGIIILLATIAVGGVKLGYVLLAVRTRLFFSNASVTKVINIIAGTVMIGIGIFLVVKT